MEKLWTLFFILLLTLPPTIMETSLPNNPEAVATPRSLRFWYFTVWVFGIILWSAHQNYVCVHNKTWQNFYYRYCALLSVKFCNNSQLWDAFAATVRHTSLSRCNIPVINVLYCNVLYCINVLYQCIVSMYCINVLYQCIVLYCIVMYCIVSMYCIHVLYQCIVLYCIVMYCIVSMYCINVLYQCIVLYCIVLYCINVLYPCIVSMYCIILYCIVSMYCINVLYYNVLILHRNRLARHWAWPAMINAMNEEIDCNNLGPNYRCETHMSTLQLELQWVSWDWL